MLPLLLTTAGGVGLPEGRGAIDQLLIQGQGVLVCAVWSIIVSYIILKVLQLTVGLRVSDDKETQGLDLSSHGETGYNAPFGGSLS